MKKNVQEQVYKGCFWWHWEEECMLLQVPYDAMHHHPDNWADPDAFIPVCFLRHEVLGRRGSADPSLLLLSGVLAALVLNHEWMHQLTDAQFLNAMVHK